MQYERISPGTTMETLIPDFRGQTKRYSNHNLETVPRLYLSIRPGARYFNSLKILSDAKDIMPEVFTKSGLMLGLGETKDEIMQVMDDLRSAHVDFLTLGQYLQPTRKHAPIKDFISPEGFDYFREVGLSLGFEAC